MKKNVAVIGSSGAIGNAISKILQDDESVKSIYNFSRSTSSNISEKENSIYIDIESEDSIKEAVQKIPQDLKFDLIFVATGILHNDDGVYPEKSIRDISADKLKKVLTINQSRSTLIFMRSPGLCHFHWDWWSFWSELCRAPGIVSACSGL